jgi:transaldolase/glucose-6-phosphate isomerase
VASLPMADSKRGVTLDATPERLGPLAAATSRARTELAERDAVARLWAADHTLWSDDPTEVSDRLGWLTVVPEMIVGLGSLRAQCSSLAAAVDHVLLMGMGGSSLFPEVVARSFGRDSEGQTPILHVVDTTEPAAIARVAAELPPERTLHVAASKSGTTLETRSHLDWAWERHPDPSRFAVITDPGSELAALAVKRDFAAVWENRPDIGGRYSALSHFGVVPALLSAPSEVDQLLASASAMAERLRVATRANPSANLAATLAAAVRSDRDKVTLVLPDEVATFGLWLEQLLAESTGKDGTGVIPVVGEPLGDPDQYGDDRLFVALGDGGDAAGLDRLAAAGHPVWTVGYEGLGDLGGQVLLWEAATALCGALLGIHPFDQPDVAAAKAATNQVLAEGLTDRYGSRPGALANGAGSVSTEPTVPLASLLDQLKPGDYLAIQAFVDPVSPVVDQLETARAALRDRFRVATTVGLGPRFLHSTGQLHKGGPNSGVFVQVVDDAAEDVPIPGRGYGFSTLERAQATGDLRTLRDRGRRVGRVTLDELLEVQR